MSHPSELNALRAALMAVEPNGRFVPRRPLDRAIRLSQPPGRLHRTAVHARAWRVRRDRLFRLLLPVELNLSANEPPELLLLPRPEGEITRQTWVGLWRTLFHVAVDREIDRALWERRLAVEAVQGLQGQLGPAAWDAARVVLEEEHLLDPEDGPERVLREFAAFAMELHYFRPAEWDDFFPGLNPSGEPLRTIRTLVDPDRLHQSARPPGLEPEPAMHAAVRSRPAPEPRLALPAVHEQANAWSGRGNDLAAAILLQAAGDPAGREYLARLIRRLERVLELSPEQSADWSSALEPLLAPAAAGGWPVERRLLYELQRACLAVERLTYAADLVDWAVTLGRRPVKRPLPHTRWLDATRRLRAAGAYADRLPSGSADRHHLFAIIESAAHRTEQQARADIGPEIEAVLDEVGLVPRSVAERLSRQKLVAELLDRASARGFLRIGDLRDAIARNRVKLPDLHGPGEFLRGDPLLRADSRLAERVDGVYRRGETYLRLFQRGCSMFFGTRTGRWLTRFVALPFGGAFLLIEAVHHMVEAAEGFGRWAVDWGNTVKGFTALAGGAAGSVADRPAPGPEWVTWPSVLTVGLFLLLLLHWTAFRRTLWAGVKFVFVRVPRAIRRSRLLRTLMDNRFTRFFRRYLFVPVGLGVSAGLAVLLPTRDGLSAALVGGGVALFTAAFFRTPVGRELEDRVDEAASRLWRLISVNFVVGLLTLVLHLFQAVFEAIERAIYAVDQWLRFREGESRPAFAVKLVFGLAWFLVTYVFRFAWTLLVEPQINPIKHFPVVTVSHKLLLPLVPSLARQFGVHPETMGTIVFGIPGIFGFLAWELRANWKLYRANAPAALQPAAVGSHGETVRALLRPGFHSGVVPKTYAKLRKAVRAGNARRAARHRHTLEHIAEAIHHLAERDLASYLNASRRWPGPPVRAGRPVVTPNRLLMPIDWGGPTPAVISFEELNGWIIASVREPGGLGGLPPDARAAFADALIGLYQLAGVFAVREQVADVCGPQAYPFSAIPDGLIIPMRDRGVRRFEYDQGRALVAAKDRLPSVTMVLAEVPLEWSDWVERWEADAAGKAPREALIPGWKVLPPA